MNSNFIKFSEQILKDHTCTTRERNSSEIEPSTKASGPIFKDHSTTTGSTSSDQRSTVIRMKWSTDPEDRTIFLVPGVVYKTTCNWRQVFCHDVTYATYIYIRIDLFSYTSQDITILRHLLKKDRVLKKLHLLTRWTHNDTYIKKKI